MDGYKKLPEGIDRQLFLTFNSQILKELGIDKYFQMLPEIVVLDEGDQLAFFMKPLRNQGSLAENIAAWQDRLALMILDDRQAALRPVALETYRLITSLTLYVQCIKKDDLDKFEAQIFANIILHLKGRGTAPGILALKLVAAEADVLKRFSEDIKAELERLTINNAIQPKPKYDEALRAVAATLAAGRTVTAPGGIGIARAPRAIAARGRRRSLRRGRGRLARAAGDPRAPNDEPGRQSCRPQDLSGGHRLRRCRRLSVPAGSRGLGPRLPAA